MESSNEARPPLALNTRDTRHRPFPATPPEDAPPSRVSSLCPHCGVETYGHIFPQDAQHRITELESQVRILSQKATNAVDKLADYEDELRKLKSARDSPATPYIKEKEAEALPPIPSPGETATVYEKRGPATTLGRFSSFRLSRKSSPQLNASVTTPPPLPAATGPSARETELSTELAQEKDKRLQAENKVSAMSSEIEELSTTLFQQANDMVADERRARAKLEERAQKFEERCGVLEGKVKTLEKRDADKRKRLERLEEGIKRVERVRGLLHGGVR